MNKIMIILIIATAVASHSVAYSEEEPTITAEEILSDRYIEIIVKYEFNVEGN